MKCKILYGGSNPVGFQIDTESEEEAYILRIMGLVRNNNMVIRTTTEAYVSGGIGRVVMLKESCIPINKKE